MAEIRRHGIKLALGYTVEGFEEKNGGVDVLLKDEPSLHADMVVPAGLPINRAALPHSSAKGPVNLAGFMIENISTVILKQFHIALLFINFYQKLSIDRIKEF